MPAHLGANAIITCKNRLLLEKRSDSDVWGLVGGGCKKWETGRQAIVREVYEELGLRDVYKRQPLRRRQHPPPWEMHSTWRLPRLWMFPVGAA